MKSEAKWQAEFIKWLECNFDCQVIKVIRANVNDFPDLILFLHILDRYLTILIECKSRGKRARQSQTQFYKKLNNVLFYSVSVLDGLDEAKDFIFDLDNEIRLEYNSRAARDKKLLAEK